MEQRDDWHLTALLQNSLGRGDPFAAAVRGTRMPMVITDPRQHDNPIVFANEAFQHLTGYSRDEIIGRNCRFLQGPETDEHVVAEIRTSIARGEAVDVDLLNYRKDGSTFWNALFLSPVRDDVGVVKFFFASQLDVTERREAQDALTKQKEAVDREVERRTQQLQSALDDKTLLLHEVDHRVKNNLNMISSLLRLQARSVKEPELAGKLHSMLTRLDALGTVHRRLYQGENITRFDVGAFLTTLIGDIFGTSGRTDIRISADIRTMFVEASRASALGLILNEILTNAVKHAFADGRSGTLAVVSRHEATVGHISIRDDGPGINAADMPRTGLGYTLMTRLAKQADVKIEFVGESSGTTVALSFPVEATP